MPHCLATCSAKYGATMAAVTASAMIGKQPKVAVRVYRLAPPRTHRPPEIHRRWVYASRKLGSVRTVLGLCINRFPAAFGSWLQYGISPSQEIERALAGRVFLTDDEQVLAGRGSEPAGDVCEPAVAHVEAVDIGGSEGPAD